MTNARDGAALWQAVSMSAMLVVLGLPSSACAASVDGDLVLFEGELGAEPRAPALARRGGDLGAWHVGKARWAGWIAEDLLVVSIQEHLQH